MPAPKATKAATAAVAQATGVESKQAVYASVELLESLGLDPTQEKALEDASALLSHIRLSPWATHRQLVSWAVNAWGDAQGVDRFNAAEAFLTKAKLIGRVG